MLARDDFDSVHVLVAQINHATWQWMRAWFQIHAEPTPFFVVGAGTEIAPELFRQVTKDTIVARRAMHALAWMLRGEQRGFVTGQDILAATLYRSWKINPNAALSILGNPLESIRSRALALRALESYWQDSSFAFAALSTLCALAEQAAERQTGLPDSVRNNLVHLLSKEESDLLLDLEYALDTGKPTLGRKSITDYLPEENPITKDVIRYLGGRIKAH